MQENLTFQKWFKELRIANGFSKRKMAEALNVTPVTVGYLEGGKIKLTPRMLLKISQRFDIPQEYIRSLKGVDL